MKEGAARVEALRAELEAAQRGFLAAQRSLRQARVDYTRNLAQERRPLAIIGVTLTKQPAEAAPPKPVADFTPQPESEIAQAETSVGAQV
eukprot:1469286-Rhodomonas_salina.3